jgi:hypothetical protein
LIPGATAGFVRFSPGGQTLFIPKTFRPPQGVIFLTLRYEDDGYGDNGYTDHDNGNDDQCLEGLNRDGGPAWIEIITHHNAPPDFSGGPYDMFAQNYDLNGLPRNPRWAPQFDPNPILPSVSGSGRAVCDTPWQTPCTSQSPIIIDLPSWFDVLHPINEISCEVGGLKGPGNGHHINWGVVTYEGGAIWGKRAFFDDDYNFNLVRDDHALQTAQNPTSMHIEFDSDETVDHFNTPWWKTFHQVVDDSIRAAAELNNTCPANTNSPLWTPEIKTALQAAIDRPKQLVTVNGKPAETIAIGFAGLDCAHECGSEIHPVLAMAIHVKDDPNDDTWAIFARNSGDEGFCSHDSILAPELMTVSIKLPWRPDASGPPQIASQTWEKSAVGGGQSIALSTFTVSPAPGLPGGFVVQVGLGDVNNSPIVDGEIHLRWPQQPVVVGLHGGSVVPVRTGRGGLRTIAIGEEKENDAAEPEYRLEELFKKLPAERRTQIIEARRAHATTFHWAPLTAVSIAAPPTEILRRAARRLPTARIATLGRFAVAPNPRKRALDEEMHRLLKDASGNQ